MKAFKPKRLKGNTRVRLGCFGKLVLQVQIAGSHISYPGGNFVDVEEGFIWKDASVHDLSMLSKNEMLTAPPEGAAP